MKTPAAAALAMFPLLLVAVAARADGPLDEVYAADRAFAARSLDSGAQSAFLDFVADDAILFRPTAVVAREWLQGHEEASGQLEWTPLAGAVACDQGLAYTLGPWTYRQQSTVANGYYVTVWRKDPVDGWKVVLDHGIDDTPAPAAGQAAALTTAWPATTGECGGRSSGGADLAAAESKLNDAVREVGIDEASRRNAATRELALRDGRAPAPRTPDWPDDETALGDRLLAVSRGLQAAPGSDMGYSYGEILLRGKGRTPGSPRAVYVRVWHRESGTWRVALDMLTVLPTATPTAQ